MYNKWLHKLDNSTKVRIFKRIERIKNENLGDYKKLQGCDSLYELRFTFGSGYRVYFTKEKNKIIILLCGGDKSTQRKDIEKAQNILLEYKNEIDKV